MENLLTGLSSVCWELCQIPSVTGSENEICLHVMDKLSHLDLIRIGNGFVAFGPADPSKPLVVLVGHLDTVPAAPRSPPYRIEGNRLHALGASDMKSGLAVMIKLAQDLAFIDLPVNLGFVFYDREEGPYSENGLENLIPKISQASLGILLEPSQNQLQLGCLGGIHAKVTFTGKRAHSARPWLGENPIHKAGKLLTALSCRPERKVEIGSVLFRETLSATIISAGGARNVIPDNLFLNLNFRYAPDLTLDFAEREILDFAYSNGADNVEIIDRAPAGRVRTDSYYLNRFVELISQMPDSNKPEAKLGWTDVARLDLAGIPSVNFGPGFSSQAHVVDEYVDVSLIAESYQKLVVVLGKLK